MKVNIELPLRTREVYQLFQRKINGNRLFIEAILHKFHVIINHCQQQEPQALLACKQIEQKMQELTRQFTNEIIKFESILAKKREFAKNKVNFVVQFRPSIIITNQLSMQLVGLINIYDKLVALLKLLHLAGCFETDIIYFENIKRVQKLANQALSSFLLTSKNIANQIL